MQVWNLLHALAHILVELLCLSLTVEALQGKMCQNSLLSGEGRLVWAKISGGRDRPWEIFLVSTKLDTFCYLTVQTAPCYVPSFWHSTGVWHTDGQTDRHTDRQTDGIAIASKALAMRALRSAVKDRRTIKLIMCKTQQLLIWATMTCQVSRISRDTHAFSVNSRISSFRPRRNYLMHFYSAPQFRPSVRPSVRLSVCHTPVLCQNDCT